MTERPSLGFIYWIQAPMPGHIKIGHSDNPSFRLRRLRYMSPVPLELVGLKVGVIQEEYALHEKFGAYRLHGEWFAETVAVLKSIVPAPKNPDELATWIDEQVAEHPDLFTKAEDITELIRRVNAAIAKG